LPDNRVNTLAEDPLGLIWAGTWSGAVQIAPPGDGAKSHIRRTFTREDGLLSDMVNVILPDSLGGIWFGSYNSRGGISYQAADGNWHSWTVADGLPHEYITAICQDQMQDVWVGTGLLSEGGAAVFHHVGGEGHSRERCPKTTASQAKKSGRSSRTRLGGCGLALSMTVLQLSIPME
jgi:hypothetical protein